MSSSDKRCSMDGEAGSKEDEEITLLFDDNRYLKSSKRSLEAVSPVLKTALNEYQHDGSLRLSGTSLEAWELILHHIGYKDPTSDTSNEIVFATTDTLIHVLKQCDKYEITSLHERIDEHIAEDFEILDSCKRRPFWSPDPEYIVISLRHRAFIALRETHLSLTEAAVVTYLIEVLKENEKRYKQRISSGKRIDISRFQTSMKRINRFLEEMYRAGRSRLLHIYARELMVDRFRIPSEALREQRDIASRKRNTNRALQEDGQMQ